MLHLRLSLSPIVLPIVNLSPRLAKVLPNRIETWTRIGPSFSLCFNLSHELLPPSPLLTHVLQVLVDRGSGFLAYMDTDWDDDEGVAPYVHYKMPVFVRE